MVERPRPITLTPYEIELYRRIVFDGPIPHERYEENSQATAALAKSLLGRKAIPDIRLRYFTDPDLNIGSRKSRLEQLRERVVDADILGHPSFRKYLKYFIIGPDLPDRTIDGFVRVLNDSLGTSGEILDQLCKFARAETRGLTLQQRHKAMEEFFKLALECEPDLHLARAVRDAVRNAR